VVYGRDGDDYLVSDPLFEMVTRCPRAALAKARFAKGAMAAKGFMYYPAKAVAAVDYGAILPAAIRANYRNMMQPILPMIGIKGIRFLGRNVAKLIRRQDPGVPQYLAHVVRMQEEIGSGGAGFRFLYASFLQEAGVLLASERLAAAAKQLTNAGDEWRRFALMATKMCRGRLPLSGAELAAQLERIADLEAAMWRSLKGVEL
jgi:hypothetical protein